MVEGWFMGNHLGVYFASTITLSLTWSLDFSVQDPLVK